MKVKLHQDLYVSSIILVLSLFFFVKSLPFPFESGLYPKILMGLIVFLNFFGLISGIRKTRQRISDNSSQTIFWNEIKKPLIALSFIVIYAALFHFLGYFIATPVFMIVFMLYFKGCRWKSLVFIPIFYLIFTYLLFVWQLEVPILHH